MVSLLGDYIFCLTDSAPSGQLFRTTLSSCGLLNDKIAAS